MAVRPRQINYLLHPLSSRQALAIALDCWSESRSIPILLIGPRGQLGDLVMNMRVILSKERKRFGSNANYGFTVSTTFPWTEGGIKGEAAVLSWRLTALQNLKNSNFTLSFDSIGKAS